MWTWVIYKIRKGIYNINNFFKFFINKFKYYFEFDQKVLLSNKVKLSNKKNFLVDDKKTKKKRSNEFALYNIPCIVSKDSQIVIK